MKKHAGMLAIAVLAGLAGTILVGGRAFSETAADKVENIGRYAAVAPNLVLDTATGGVKDGAGQVVVPPAEPNGSTLGKYDAAGFVTTLTTAATISGLGRSEVSNRLIKGVSVVDTTTGRLVVNRLIYYNQPLAAEDLQ